jgi:hypothetical protein
MRGGVAARLHSDSCNDRSRNGSTGNKNCRQKMRFPEGASGSGSYANNDQTRAVESVRQRYFVIGYRPVRNACRQEPRQKSASQPMPGTFVHRLRLSVCSSSTARIFSLRLVILTEVQAEPVPPRGGCQPSDVSQESILLYRLLHLDH